MCHIQALYPVQTTVKVRLLGQSFLAQITKTAIVATLLLPFSHVTTAKIVPYALAINIVSLYCCIFHHREGATTLSITTLRITTLSITTFSKMTFSITIKTWKTTLSIFGMQCVVMLIAIYAECQFAVSCVLSIVFTMVMPGAIIVNFVLLRHKEDITPPPPALDSCCCVFGWRHWDVWLSKILF